MFTDRDKDEIMKTAATGNTQSLQQLPNVLLVDVDDQDAEIQENTFKIQPAETSLPVEETTLVMADDRKRRRKNGTVLSRLWAEFDLKTMFTDRDTTEIITTAAPGLVLGVLPSSADVFSDYRLFFSYLFGALYNKRVDDQNHNYVNSTDCELSQKTTVEAWSGTEWLEESVQYDFTCMEVDVIFAVFTVVFILLPGFWWWGSQLDSNGIFAQHKCLVFCCGPLIIPLYPVILVTSKLVAMFHQGPEFKQFCLTLSVFEGRYEAAPQLCLQLFVVLTRFDRSPTYLQWVAIISSAVSLNLPNIEDFNRANPADGLKAKILQILKMLPLFLSTSLFRIMSFALVSIFLRYYAFFFFYGAIVLGVLVAAYTRLEVYKVGFLSSAFTITDIGQADRYFDTLSKNNKITFTDEEKPKALHRHKLFHLLFWFTLNTITLLIIVILANTADVSFSVFGAEHVWHDIPIIADIWLLNTIAGATMGCGVLSLGLFFLQI